jgi:hypothetical protein
VTYESISFDEDENEENVRISMLKNSNCSTRRSSRFMETFPTPLTFTFLLQIQTLGRTLKQLFRSSCPADTVEDREMQLKVRHCYLYQLAGQINIRPRAVPD